MGRKKKEHYPVNQPVWKEVMVMQPFCPKCLNDKQTEIVMQSTESGIYTSFKCFFCGHTIQ